MRLDRAYWWVVGALSSFDGPLPDQYGILVIVMSAEWTESQLGKQVPNRFERRGAVVLFGGDGAWETGDIIYPFISTLHEV